MGTATLGFPGGPAIAFRVDPDSIAWNFEVLTNVVETIGGRVIQIIGSQLEDMTLTGSFGQDHSTAQGESWRQAEAFLLLIQQIMDWQSQDSNKQSAMHLPAVFTYPPKNWRFNVYVKDFSDADNPGTSIVLTPGKFNQRWQLTLFIVQDSSTALVQAGESNGVINTQAEAAIAAYMSRISDGIGWTFTQYTGLKNGADLARDQAAAAKLYPNLATQGAQVSAGSGGTSGTSGTGGQTVVSDHGTNQSILQQTAAKFGWGSGAEWTALYNIEMSEAGFDTHATNPSSKAFGMAQAYQHGTPGSAGTLSNMYGANYGLTTAQAVQANSGDAATQSLWMCTYIQQRYTTPSRAWAYHLANNSY